MTPPTLLALRRAEARLRDRLAQLEAQLDAGETSLWSDYCVAASALAALTTLAEQTGTMLTTRELAERLQVHPKTVLRRRKRGELQPAAVLGQRGRAALRWRA